MAIDIEEAPEPTGPRPDRITVLLSALLAVVLVATALVALYVVQGRSDLKAVLAGRPAPTIGTPGAGPSPTLLPGQATPTRIAQLPTATSVLPVLPATPTTAVVVTTPRPATATPSAIAVVTATAEPGKPSAARSWFFAEGATVPPFRTFFAVLNPGSGPARVSVTLYPERGNPVRRTVEVAARSQVRIAASDLLPNAVFGAQVTSDQPVYVERVTIGDRDGTTSPGVLPVKVWYFPEARTAEEFTTWLLVLNPGSSPASLAVTYLPLGGAAVVRKYTVAAGTRLTIPAHADGPKGVMGMILESDQPVVAEHSIYFDDQKAAYGGHGVPVLSKTWYVSAGNTQEGFTTQVAVLNPHADEVMVKTTVISRDQPPVTESYPVPPRSKHDIVLNDLAEGQIVAAVLEATQPVAAQTVTFYQSPAAAAAYSSAALLAPASAWYLPDTPASEQYASYLMLLNPGTQAASLTVTYFAQGGTTVEKSYSLGAMARMSLSVNDEVRDRNVTGVEVRSSQAVVAERVTIFRTSVGATSSAGIPGP